MTNPDKVSVEQVDREAGWAIARFYLGNDGSFPDELRDGRIERHFTLDILARHRATAVEQARKAAIEEAAAWHDQRAKDTPDAFEQEFHEVSATAIRALSDKEG